MHRIIATFLFASVVGAMTMSSAALAGEWDVNGTKLVGTAALSNSVLALTGLTVEVPSVGFVFACPSQTVEMSGGRLAAPDTLLIGGMTFKECSSNIQECPISGGLITTKPAQGLASLEGSLNAFIELLPETGQLFATIPFEGKCETTGLHGGIDLLLGAGRDPQTFHLALGFTLENQLGFFSSEARISAFNFDLKLASNQTWDFL